MKCTSACYSFDNSKHHLSYFELFVLVLGISRAQFAAISLNDWNTNVRFAFEAESKKLEVEYAIGLHDPYTSFAGLKIISQLCLFVSTVILLH